VQTRLEPVQTRLEPEPEPPGPRPAEPVRAPARPAPAVTLHFRFVTAWAALVFAGQLPASQPLGALPCFRGGPGDGWWIQADLTIDTAREMASITSGDIYLSFGDGLTRDRGWGSPGQGLAVKASDLRSVPLLDLVRAAGLHPGPPRPLPGAVLLLPGYLVAGVARRALDLQLDVTYRPVMLEPLFEPGRPVRSGYELCLRAAHEATVPAFLIAALARDPFILVCRRAADTLLVRYQMTAPLADRALASLTGDATWVLADAAYGCTQLRALGEPQDGASLVHQGSDHRLTDVGTEADWAEQNAAPAGLAAPELTLVRAEMSGMPVDAALLDDADLECLPALLAGEPLAESAMLIRGRDRHLVTAAGGLLEQLPVGEPLYCLGPGSLYVPLGHRLQPRLPAAARRKMFPADASSAIVLMPHAALRFDLETRVPVWELWLGTPPPVDYQVDESALADLEAVEREVTGINPAARELGLVQSGPGQPQRRAPGREPTVPRPVSERDRVARLGVAASGAPLTWRDKAYAAELAEDYVTAAELHTQHGEPLRAARLYERAAERR
jgi:FtsH ternary system domain X7